MPGVNWGLDVKKVETFDRDAQFAPYRGQIPPNAVYKWRITKLQFLPGGAEKYPQLRIYVEIVPRTKAEQRYAGFRVVSFRSVADHIQFNYVPLLDALGVSVPDFVNRTKADGEGNIIAIGKWRNNGKQEIEALLKDDSDKDGKARKDIGWIGSVIEDDLDDDDEYDDDSDEEFADDEDDEDGEYDLDEYDDDSDYDDE